MTISARTNLSQPGPDSSPAGQGVLRLLGRLMDELTTLFRQEVALATAELTSALTKLTASVISIAAGGAVLFLGIALLLASAVLGLATVIAPWLAALIVGGVVSVLGAGMILAGRKGVDPSILKPHRSADSLRRDKEVLSRSV